MIVHGNGEEPDSYYVIPRTGFTVDKEEGSANEGESITFNICPMLLS